MFLPKGMQHTALVGKTMVRGGALAAQFRGCARGAIGYRREVKGDEVMRRGILRKMKIFLADSKHFCIFAAKNKYFHVAGFLKQEHWKGKTKMQIQIHDIAPV